MSFICLQSRPRLPRCSNDVSFDHIYVYACHLTKHIQKKKKGKTTPWLSKKTISLADESKDAKRVGDKYKVRSLNRAFQKQAREDTVKHLNDMCKMVEEEVNKGRTKCSPK